MSPSISGGCRASQRTRLRWLFEACPCQGRSSLIFGRVHAARGCIAPLDAACSVSRAPPSICSTRRRGFPQPERQTTRKTTSRRCSTRRLACRSALQRLRGAAPLSPEQLLLSIRLICVGLIAAGVFGPLRATASRRSAGFAVMGLALLALPGASESLARCSNDAAVFLWVAFVMAALDAKPRPRTLALLMGLGPLLKLTAWPLVVVMFVVLWRRGSRRSAVLGVLLSLLSIPLQLLRGWGWGGTLELNRPTPAFSEPLTATLVGLARSAYTFVKTAFWLGEWSFFRSPVALLAAGAALAVLWIAAARWNGAPDLALAHLSGGLTAFVGWAVFAMANRKYWGTWGGVGGWYFWSWFPWLAVAANDLFRVKARWRAPLIGAAAVFCLVSNAVYYEVASRIYG